MREAQSRLATFAGREVTEAAKNQLLSRHAQDIVDTLGRLKGAAMKGGQILSLEFSDLLPPEVVEILRELHDEASFVSYQEIEKRLRRDWGVERYTQVESTLSREPFAAASIGQVHEAALGDRRAAVKVQFPGVDKTIDSDLALLRSLVSAYLRFRGKQLPLDELFAELSQNLKREADYRKEAQSLEAYREHFAGDERFVIPQVFSDWSTRRVLALSYEEGTPLKRWFQQDPTPQERQRFGELVLELLIKEFFETGLVQTDPNSGNFLYRPAEGQLVLFDFGATRKFSKDLRRKYQRLLVEAEAQNEERVFDYAAKLFQLDEREPEKVRRLFLELMNSVVDIFRPENQPFNFADPEYIETARNRAFDFVQSVTYTPPPKDLVFLNRKVGGMFHLLKDAGCCMDMRPYWDRLVGAEIG